MRPFFSNTLEELQLHFRQIEKETKIKSCLLFIAETTLYKTEELNHIIGSFSKPVIGGIFPELIYESERKKSGILIIPLNFKLVTMDLDLEDDETSFYSKINALHSNQAKNAKTIFIFIDAEANRKSNYIEYLFNYFGISVSYFGAGCGSLYSDKKDCVLSNTGIKNNSAVIGLTDEPIALSMSRSWEPISEQMKVCEAEENKVKVINWEPALHVYKSIIEKHAGKTIKNEDIPDLLKSYPFGLIKIDGDIIVRDPSKIEGDEILFFDKIKKGEYVCVMHGNKESILKGAETAKTNLIEACSPLSINHSNFTLCINCISRVLYLQDDYKKEFNLFDDYKPVYGVLSIGEIVNPGVSILEMFNKVLALAIWNQ